MGSKKKEKEAVSVGCSLAHERQQPKNCTRGHTYVEGEPPLLIYQTRKDHKMWRKKTAVMLFVVTLAYLITGKSHLPLTVRGTLRK